jgi:hypothetical protein
MLQRKVLATDPSGKTIGHARSSDLMHVQRAQPVALF